MTPESKVTMFSVAFLLLSIRTLKLLQLLFLYISDFLLGYKLLTGEVLVSFLHSTVFPMDSSLSVALLVSVS